MRRPDLEAAVAADHGRQPFERNRERPEDVLGRTADGSTDEDDEGRSEIERREPQDRLHHAGGRRPCEERRVYADDHDVGDPERKPATAEGVRDRERQDEIAAHATE